MRDPKAVDPMQHTTSDLVSPTEPKRFGRYTVLRRLGAGPVTETLLARDGRLRRGEDLVVVKRIRPGQPNAAALTRALLDAASLAALVDHPGLVRVLDGGTIEGSPFVAMEHVGGPTLERFAEERPVPLRQALSLVADACAALSAAHGHEDEDGSPLGAFHGRVSPGNIMVGPDGSARVADLAIARAVALAGEAPARPAYLAPEQRAGSEGDHRADIYGCGAVLYRLVTGRDPGERGRAATGDEPEVFLPPRRIDSAIPAEVEEVIMRAMAVDPEERFESCEAMGRELQGMVTPLAGSGRAQPAEPGPAVAAAPAAGPKSGNTLVSWTQGRGPAASRTDPGIDQAMAAFDALIEDDRATLPPGDDLPSVEITVDDGQPGASAPPAAAVPSSEPTAEPAGLAPRPVTPRTNAGESELLAGLAAARRDPKSAAPPPPPAASAPPAAGASRPAAQPRPSAPPPPPPAARPSPAPTAAAFRPSPPPPPPAAARPSPPPPPPAARPSPPPPAAAPEPQEPAPWTTVPAPYGGFAGVQTPAATPVPTLDGASTLATPVPTLDGSAAYATPAPTLEGSAAVVTPAPVAAAPRPPERRSSLVGLWIAAGVSTFVLIGVIVAAVLLAPRMIPGSDVFAAGIASGLGIPFLGGSVEPTSALPAVAPAPASAPVPAPALAPAVALPPPPVATEVAPATPPATPEPAAAPEPAPEVDRPTRRGRDARARAGEAEPAAVAEPTGPAEPEPPAARAEGSGTLTVLTTPYCRVYMDGRLLGTSPLLNREVPAGRHSLTLVAAEGGTRQLNILVRRGRLTQVRENLWSR